MNALRLFGILALLAAVPSAQAQFGLDKLDLGKINKALDTAKDVSKVAKGVAGIGPEEERVIGGSVAVEIVGAYGGLVHDEAITRRVNLLGRTLARYSDRPNLEWRFGVLASDEVNAFSAPAGYVFITRGLYRLAADDDMLAGILAHEIAHVTEKHALAIVARGEFLTGATNIAKSQSTQVANLEGQLQQFDLGIKKITKTLFEAGFDPPTEYAADRKGRDLATLTGYGRDGLPRTLKVLQQQKPADQKKVFSSHPPLAERVKRLSDGSGK
jgi:predicted Zn-dependent protease